jgi:hypothetical protein
MPSASRRDDRFARQHPLPGQGFTRRGFEFRYFILYAIYRVGLDPVAMATFLALRERLIPGADSYYHLAIARAISLGRVPLDLPWVRLSAKHYPTTNTVVRQHRRRAVSLLEAQNRRIVHS